MDEKTQLQNVETAASPASPPAETKTVFFIPLRTPDGRESYLFLRAPHSAGDAIDPQCIERGELPAQATILEAGEGWPNERTWFNMERLGHVRSLAAA